MYGVQLSWSCNTFHQFYNGNLWDRTCGYGVPECRDTRKAHDRTQNPLNVPVWKLTALECSPDSCRKREGSFLLGSAADFTDHHDPLGIRILFKGIKAVNEIGADNRIAADADTGTLSDSLQR